MYEDVMLALAAVTIYLQVRSQMSDVKATRIFYSLMSLFTGILLAGTAVIAAGTYGPSMQTAATAGLAIMVAIGIMESIMLLLWIAFYPLMPPKYQAWLRIWWD